MPLSTASRISNAETMAPVGQHLDLQPPARHLVDPLGVALEELEVDAGRRHRGLHPDLLLRQGRRRLPGQGGTERDEEGEPPADPTHYQ
jgi:hypothetical protein